MLLPGMFVYYHVKINTRRHFIVKPVFTVPFHPYLFPGIYDSHHLARYGKNIYKRTGYYVGEFKLPINPCIRVIRVRVRERFPVRKKALARINGGVPHPVILHKIRVIIISAGGIGYNARILYILNDNGKLNIYFFPGIKHKIRGQLPQYILAAHNRLCGKLVVFIY